MDDHSIIMLLRMCTHEIPTPIQQCLIFAKLSHKFMNCPRLPEPRCRHLSYLWMSTSRCWTLRLCFPVAHWLRTVFVIVPLMKPQTWGAVRDFAATNTRNRCQAPQVAPQVKTSLGDKNEKALQNLPGCRVNESKPRHLEGCKVVLQNIEAFVLHAYEWALSKHQTLS
jgi:hypothetical protein